MAGAGESPFLDGDATRTQADSEFALRPLRIQKRPGAADKLPKPDTVVRLDKHTKPEQPAEPDGFVCRPMRLGLTLTPQRTASYEGKHCGGPSHEPTVEPAGASPGKALALAEGAPATPGGASLASASGSENHASIEIKNLPIEPLPRRAGPGTQLEPTDRVFAICLVDFHHVRGPEVQWWKLNYHPDPGPQLFRNLPFQALPDGLHLFEETFSNFHLVYDFGARCSLDDLRDIEAFRGNPNHLETLFGCACVRQAKTAELSQTERDRTGELTRSIVQKAVVVISRRRPIFTKIREKLSIITHSFFQQDSFGEFELLESLFENLNEQFGGPKALAVVPAIFASSAHQAGPLGLPSPNALLEHEPAVTSIDDALAERSLLSPASEFSQLQLPSDSVLPNQASSNAPQKDPTNLFLEYARLPDHHEEEDFVSLDLRALLGQFQHALLVVLKAIILEKRVLVYSNNNLELLTQFQNNMIALVPNLINNLELAGCPLCDYTEKYSPLEKPATLKTNDRTSMLRFFGLPLQVFNTKGSFWNPYLPLPQMDELSAPLFMAGCSNLLIVNQLARFKVDVLVDLDAWTVSFPCGRPEELRLSYLDKKFVAVLLATQSSARDAYVGSDDYIRSQFEDYIRSLVATMRFLQYVERFGLPPPGFDPQTDRRLGNLKLFNTEFVSKWLLTKNFQIWNAICDEFVFNFHMPAHVATEMDEAGGAYNLGGFLLSFIKPQTATFRGTQGLVNSNQPRKYIASEEPDTDPEPAAAKSTWWGRKRG